MEIRNRSGTQNKIVEKQELTMNIRYRRKYKEFKINITTDRDKKMLSKNVFIYKILIDICRYNTVHVNCNLEKKISLNWLNVEDSKLF